MIGLKGADNKSQRSRQDFGEKERWRSGIAAETDCFPWIGIALLLKPGDAGLVLGSSCKRCDNWSNQCRMIGRRICVKAGAPFKTIAGGIEVEDPWETKVRLMAT